MDITVNYKEMDKKSEVAKVLGGEMMVCNNQIRLKSNCAHATIGKIVSAVDAIYKKDSQQIESVEISKYSSVVKMILKSCSNLLGINIQVSDRIHAISFEKYEVEQIIEILQQIHDQMD